MVSSSDHNEAIAAARKAADEVPFLRPPALRWGRQRLLDEIEKLSPPERELYDEWRALYHPAQKPSENGWASLLAMERVQRHRSRVEAFGPAIADLWMFTGTSAVARDPPPSAVDIVHAAVHSSHA